MKILNVGPLELVFIFILALIVLGPNDLAKYGRQLGTMIRKFVKSPLWRDIINTTREIQDLPKKMMRETKLDQTLTEVESSLRKTEQLIQNTAHDIAAELPVNLTEKKVSGPSQAIQPGRHAHASVSPQESKKPVMRRTE